MNRFIRTFLVLLGFGIATSCDQVVLENYSPRTILLAGGDVVLNPPSGYCVDTGNSRDNGVEGGFALLSSCPSLLGKSASPAVITVSVGPEVGISSISLSAFEDALGNPAILSSEESTELALLHLAKGGEMTLPGGDPRHWRAVRVVSGRLVSMALYAPEGTAQAEGRGRTLIKRVAQGVEAIGPQA